METTTRSIYGLDPTKYPARKGKGWDDEESTKLLISVRKKKTIEEIAIDHERTVGGIRGQLKKLAVEYHLNDQRSIDEIHKITGLSKVEIEDAIERAAIREAIKNEKAAAKVAAKSVPPRWKEVDDPYDIVPTPSEEPYARAGNPWSSNECDQLIDEYKNKGLTLMEISKLHQRKPSGIAARLTALDLVQRRSDVEGYTEYKNGTTPLHKEGQIRVNNIAETLRPVRRDEDSDDKLNAIVASLNALHRKLDYLLERVA